MSTFSESTGNFSTQKSKRKFKKLYKMQKMHGRLLNELMMKQNGNID